MCIRDRGRAGQGVRTLRITNKTGPVADAKVIDDSKEVYVVSEQAQVLRTHLSEIRNTDRVAQGVTIFKPAEGDAVASISCVSDLSLQNESEDKTAKPKSKASKASTNGRRNGRANGTQPKLLG